MVRRWCGWCNNLQNRTS